MPDYNANKQYDFYYVNSPQYNKSIDLIQGTTVACTTAQGLKRNSAGQTITRFGNAHERNNQLAIVTSKGIPPLNPFQDVSVGSTPRVSMTYGTFGGLVPTIDGTNVNTNASLNIVTLGSSDETVYCQCDFTYDTSTGETTIEDAIISSTNTAYTPESTIGGGSGTVYQALFGTNITYDGSGNAHVSFAPAVGGSQNFLVCLLGPAIQGPWVV